MISPVDAAVEIGALGAVLGGAIGYRKKKVILGALAGFMVGCAIWLLMFFFLQHGTEKQSRWQQGYLDNGLDRDVVIEVDGGHFSGVPSHCAVPFDLTLGKHTIRVSDNPEKVQAQNTDIQIARKTIEENQIEVASTAQSGRWVYNVSAKNHYQEGPLDYATPFVPGSMSKLGDGQVFFQLPLTTTYFLPADIPLLKGQPGSPVRVVYHWPLHGPTFCCGNLGAMLHSGK